ncbi:MAG TPA: DUF4194 domain-containing protein [Marinagarivorans sp.]
MSSIFDQLTSTDKPPTGEGPATQQTVAPESHAAVSAATSQHTGSDIKNAAQELLKHGLLEFERKPNLYKIARTQQEAIDRVLEPLDLRLQLDEVRGLAFVVVAQTFAQEGDDDEWSHPLIRRQRLNLEQSLMIAILRQYYVSHEQEAGIGAAEATVALDELLPQLQLFLGDIGSDAREQKRLRNLLEHLKSHGIVSDIDAKDQITIRPIITHLANPENLQNLLQHLRQRATGSNRKIQAEDEE